MIRRKDDIKAHFKKNCVPSETDFEDLIDSSINQQDDGLKKSAGDPLTIIAGGDTQEVFSFYSSFEAKKPSWNTNLNPEGSSPGLNFYTPDGTSRFFINHETGNVGIGNAALKKQTNLVGPFLQIGNDNSGISSGQLILSRHVESGSGRSFKMGLDDRFNFSIGDFGRSADESQVYSPGISIDYDNQNVSIPKRLDVGKGLLLTGDGKIVFRNNVDDKTAVANVPDLGLYSTIESHNMRFAVNQAAIAFFNNKSKETIAEGNISLLIDKRGNVGIGNGDKLEVVQIGENPVLQIGNDRAGDNAGQLVLSRHSSTGGSRSFKLGLDENFAFSLGDFENSGSGRTYTAALTVDWDKKNVTIPQSLVVKGAIAGSSGLVFENTGAIRLADPAAKDDITGACTDLGLYSGVEHKWIRMVTNQAPIVFFNNKKGEKGYGSDAPSMLIDTNRNVGIGTSSVLTGTATNGPILQIGHDGAGENYGQLLLSTCTKKGLNRTYKMAINDDCSFVIGDFGYAEQGDKRSFQPAIVVHANTQNVEIKKLLTLDGTTATASDFRIKRDIVSCDSRVSLNILNKLDITDYRHIDPVNFGDSLVKGLIAQQVETVFPEAVLTRQNFLPTILAAPTSIIETDGLVTFTLPKPHLLTDDDIVKICTKVGEKQVAVTVIDDASFSVQGKVADYSDDVVVYGKRVNDFKSIDYNRLFILNLSATQQLAKENDEIKEQLRQVVGGLDRYFAKLDKNIEETSKWSNLKPSKWKD